MNSTDKLNKITYLMKTIVKEFQLGFFENQIDTYINNPANHDHLVTVYDKVAKIFNK